MSRCEEIRPLIYPYLDQELEGDRVERVEEHLKACPECERLAGAEGRFLARVAEAGRERAPASLRSRVEDLLGEEREEAAVVPIRSPGWRRILVPATAAAALALLLLRPWSDSPPSARAASFAADHAAHAVTAPGLNPFPDATRIPPPPPLRGAHLAGLSGCVVEGAIYAHYTYVLGDAHVSVFVPLKDGPLPGFREERDGGPAVVSVESTGSTPGAVLVSGELDADELQAIWAGV